MLQPSPEWQIIGEAADGLEAIQKAEELHPDVVLLDVGMPLLNGIEAAKTIFRIVPDAKVLFVSVDLCPELVKGALRTGAHGYVVKADASSDLQNAMRAVLRGERFVGTRFSDYDFSSTDDSDRS